MFDEYNNTFEINLVVRNAQGHPTSKRKSYSTDSAEELWKFFMRNQGTPKKYPKKNRNNKKDGD